MLMGFADTVQVGRMAHGSVQALAAAADANGIFFNIAIIGYICTSSGATCLIGAILKQPRAM
jgi:Na+-driven multidrug efflux pump